MLKKINLFELLNTIVILAGIVFITGVDILSDTGLGIGLTSIIFALAGVVTYYTVGSDKKNILPFKIIWSIVFVIILGVYIFSFLDNGQGIGAEYIVGITLFYYVSFRVLVTLEKKETSASYNLLILISYLTICFISMNGLESLSIVIYVLLANLLLSTYAKETKPKKIKK